jgi:hypothetical protein
LRFRVLFCGAGFFCSEWLIEFSSLLRSLSAYGYQNGVRGFIESVSLRRDLPQAKALAYTAGCIHARDRFAEITAITDTAPDAENPRPVFVERPFGGEGIRIVAMSQVEGFAEDLRQRIQ